MKKHSLLLIIPFFFFFNYIFAQQTFEKIISEPEDQIINHIIEDNDGNFIMVGRIKNKETSLFNGYLIKIDSTGDLIQNEEYGKNDTSFCGFFNIHYYNNFYYILGSYMVASTETSELWYLKLNSNLEIEDEKFLKIPSGKWFSYMNSIVDSDTNLVITGYTSRHDEIYTYNYDAFFYKLNMNGDSSNSKFYTSYIPLYFSFDIIESQDSTKYYAFVSNFESTSGGQKLILNKNLDSLSIDSIPLGIYDFYSPTYINENEILLCGKGSPDQSELYALNVISINEQTELIDYNSFKKQSDMREHPSMFNGISKNDNNLYVSGTSNLDYYNPFYSTKNSWFHLIKINPDISPIWEYWYGGDAYYFLYSILATNDGGCIMVGIRYDYETQSQESDIYIVKVNNVGLMVWEQEITVEENLSTVYPNPGTNSLNIKTPNSTYNFELINFSGNVVASSTITGVSNSINTAKLASGIYFYRLLNVESGKVETGKWIKR